jgi:threonine/homoserine/homoserine lactone efflux protein
LPVSLGFLLTALLVVATPGSGVLFTMSAGLRRGARAGLLAAFGCTLGIVPHMVASITGLAALLNTSAAAFQTLRYLGVAYLLIMAWGTLRDRTLLSSEATADASAPSAAPSAGPSAGPSTSPPAGPSTSPPARPSTLRVISTSVLVNVLNPKLTIFFFAFLPQFVRFDEPHATLRLVELSGVFMALTFAVFAGYGVFAAAIRGQVSTRPQILTWLRRVIASGFVALSARLVLTDR